MSVDLTINGTIYAYPENGDSSWGVQATNWAIAVTSGMLQKAGGSFTLTAEVDFGATYGLKTAYYKSQTSNSATAGQVRLARADVISFRNQANSANLDLGVNASNVLTFNGEVIPAGEIVNADIAAAAAIAFSKMAALTASRAVVTDGSGVIGVSAATATEVGYLSGVTSAIQTQLAARLPLAGGTMTGDLFLNADPSSATQAATKSYVDSLVTGLQPKTACRVATTANINLATDLENGDTLDGVVLATGNRVLVKDQSTASQNGIYVVPASGAASRATDMDTWTETLQAYVFVTSGTVNAATGWVSQSTAGGTIGVTSLTFTQFLANTAYSADGEGLELSGSQFALELDGTTLSKSATGLKVNEVANAQIAAAAAIAVNKLAALTANRVMLTDASGFASASSVTNTTLSYLDATSSIQTQLDAKVAASTLTTNGDMLYRAAGVPTRLAIGTSGYVLQSDGSIPVWTNKNISSTYFEFTSSYSVLTSFTALTLGAVTSSVGTPVTRASNTIQFPFTGYYKVQVFFGNLTTTSSRKFLVRLRNTTDGTTLAISTAIPVGGDDTSANVLLFGNVSDVSKIYEIQVASSGTGISLSSTTIDSVASRSYQILIERLNQ